MTTKKYDLLMRELGKISDTVKSFPEPLQDKVLTLILQALLDSDGVGMMVSDSQEDSDLRRLSDTKDRKEHVARNYASELLEYYRRHNLANCNDMEFAAFVAYYFISVAPEEQRVEAVGDSHYEGACQITGRSLPKRVSGALNNSKNVKGYLERKGTGMYGLTSLGQHFVTHELLKEVE